MMMPDSLKRNTVIQSVHAKEHQHCSCCRETNFRNLKKRVAFFTNMMYNNINSYAHTRAVQ